VVPAVLPAGTGGSVVTAACAVQRNAGSVLLIQGVAIGGQGSKSFGATAAADVIELASFPAPAVLAGDSLPPGCTWQPVATLPFKLVTGQGATR